MADTYTGVRTLTVNPEQIDELYREREMALTGSEEQGMYPNTFVVLKTPEEVESRSALTQVSKCGQVLLLLDSKITDEGIKPRNKEQNMALSALMDVDVSLVVLTGRAGTGKTLCALAAAMHQVQNKTYEKIIITKPMTQVGRWNLGHLPGTLDEKFHPYLASYFGNLEQIVQTKDIETLMRAYQIECVPLQLIRGGSYRNAFILADETQVLNHHEMLTLGTRVAAGSKIVIMGDLGQRDDRIERESTGLYKLFNNRLMKESKLVAHLELIKNERSPISQLFGQVFEEVQ